MWLPLFIIVIIIGVSPCVVLSVLLLHLYDTHTHNPTANIVLNTKQTNVAKNEKKRKTRERREWENEKKQKNN